MEYYALDICPNKTSGLCNQLYSITAGIKYCIQNKINIMFIDKFLKSININRYCLISEIIDIPKFNVYLKKYNVHIIDFNNFNFIIENAELTDGIITKNVKDMIIDSYYQKNNFYIKKNSRFYLTNGNNKLIYLNIKYNLDGYYFSEKYLIENNELVSDIKFIFNYELMNFEGNFNYKQDEVFFDILRNINFSDIILYNSFVRNKRLFKNKKTEKINAIHLRIEDDAINHYSKYLNMDTTTYKNIIENKYIQVISKLNKNDLIIILSYSKENNVIDYLKKNGYNFIMDENKVEDREISAIYDLLLGENCNDTYVCVWESSYSYTLYSRINKKHHINAIQIYYENLEINPTKITLLY
jgi:hypothetical protein